MLLFCHAFFGNILLLAGCLLEPLGPGRQAGSYGLARGPHDCLGRAGAGVHWPRRAPSEGLKPSPDCTASPNSGWLRRARARRALPQVHVSGTGGGPKVRQHPAHALQRAVNTRRCNRRTAGPGIAELGYYHTQLAAAGARPGIGVEITASPKVSFYRLAYPKGQPKGTANRRRLVNDYGLEVHRFGLRMEFGGFRLKPTESNH
ncbi:MAG: hypothetical protein WKG07_11365 [Hymenobacter sp.]